MSYLPWLGFENFCVRLYTLFSYTSEEIHSAKIVLNRQLLYFLATGLVWLLEEL